MFAKDYRTTTSGLASLKGQRISGDIQRGAGFKIGDFGKEKLGGLPTMDSIEVAHFSALGFLNDGTP